MASPSGSSAPGGFKYDVFLSYRGDTLKTFVSHLHAALDRKKIKTCRDNQLERGEEIKPALLKAIEGSKLSVVILSQNYASSTWCLDELDQIWDCKERYQQLVIPIFYEVDPSHVRWQRESFADAFVQHEQHFKDTPDKVLKWRNALTNVSNLAGFDSRNIGLDSELVEAVVKDIEMKLNPECSSDSKAPVGIEFQLCIALDVQYSNGKKLDRSVAEDKCFKCHGRGHWFRDCPLAGDQEMYGVKRGREAYSSSGQSNYGGRDGSSVGRDECFKCRRTGHWVRDCPYFKCGRTGHWAGDCPSAGDQERHGLSQAGGEDSNNDYTSYSYGGRRSTDWEEDESFNCGGTLAA